MSPEPTPSLTVPLGIVSFFRKPAVDRPALLLLKFESDGAGEAAVDLAEALARDGHRIVLCDLSLSSPELHRVLGVPSDEGMTDLFEFGASLRHVTTRVRDGSLFFAPAGVGVADPERLARHPRWDRLLAGAADADATLLLYAPADLPGIADIARRVRAAAVIGTEADADSVAASLPEGCALLDRVPLRGEDVDETVVDDGVSDHAGLPGFAPFDTDYSGAYDPAGAWGPPESGFEDAEKDLSEAEADLVEAAASDSVLAALARRDTDVEADSGAGSVEAATPPPVAEAATPPPVAEAATPKPPVEAATPPPVAEAATHPPDRDGDASPRVRTGLWIGLGILVALLLVLFWALMPDAGAEPNGTEETPAEPALAEAAIPATPQGGEIASLGYTVAIEAHLDLDTARVRLARLRRAEQGMPFLITPFVLDGVVFYRVMAGPYADSAEAVVVRDLLYRDGRKPTVGDWDVRPTTYGFLIDELDDHRAALERAEGLMEAGIPAYAVDVGPDGASRVYAGAFELREQAPVLAGPLERAGLDPPLVRIAGWVPSP